MNKYLFMWLILLLIVPLPLFGYLDPGSGSMLFSAVIGIVATIFFVIKGLFFKLIDIPAYLGGIRRGKRTKHSIVFYSEGPQYWNVFLPVLRELSKRCVRCTYLSSNEKDPGLNCGFEYVETKYIGEGNRAFFYLNTLEADVCVMTTPGLDILQIKRSKGVKKFVHITHSAGGCSGYSTFGVDYYDAVLTGGEGDKQFIETIEKIRNLPKKSIEIAGCTYLDAMREKLQERNSLQKNSNGRTTVLVSPTWGNHGLLNKYGSVILGKLTEVNRFNIIVRPHPQSFMAEKETIGELMKNFPTNEHFVWDREPDGLDSMCKADIMISDFSGIVFDFVFLFKKPVLSFKTHYDRKGKDSMDYPEIPWNIRNVEKTGRTLEEKDIDNLVEIIDEIIVSGLNTVDFDFLREGMDKYPYESGNRCAEFIINSMS